jgi:hypothetical protein
MNNKYETNKASYRSCFDSKENSNNTLPLSIWRTAFASVLIETDESKMRQRISDACSAIQYRLNSPIEISVIERKSLRSAQDALAALLAVKPTFSLPAAS